ncbi:MAG: hypothetical protein Q4A65_06615 [Bacillota bacterium]|nr:hypothetical protein [Bacillota bacterium]
MKNHWRWTDEKNHSMFLAREARGADAVDECGNQDPNAGKLVCLDGDGLTGEPGQAVKNEDELMTDPATLKAFINYGVIEILSCGLRLGCMWVAAGRGVER